MLHIYQTALKIEKGSLLSPIPFPCFSGQVVNDIPLTIFMPKHEGQIQLLLYRIKMLRDRIPDPRIIPTPDERAELLRLGAEIDHDIAEIMLVVKPQTYRRWRNKKAAKIEKEKTACRPETPKETVKLVIQLATENIAWGLQANLG